MQHPPTVFYYDKIGLLHQDINDAKDIVKDNIYNIIDRGQQLDEIYTTTVDMPQDFSSPVRKRNNGKWCALISVVLVISGILLYLVISYFKN